MAWTKSGILSSFMKDVHGNTAAFDLDTAADSIKVALFNSTPITATAEDDTSAHNAYNGTGGQWLATSEIADNSNGWATAGLALANQALTSATGVMKYDADDRASTAATTTMANIYGCLLYDDTLAAPVAKQAICMVYFGGTVYSTSNGSFTIVWAAGGIFTINGYP